MSAYRKQIGDIELNWSRESGWCRITVNYNSAVSEGFDLKSTEQMRDLHYVLGEALRAAEADEVRRNRN